MVDRHSLKLHVKLVLSTSNVHQQTAIATIERTRRLTISALPLPFPCFCTMVVGHVKLDTRLFHLLCATLKNWEELGDEATCTQDEHRCFTQYIYLRDGGPFRLNLD